VRGALGRPRCTSESFFVSSDAASGGASMFFGTGLFVAVAFFLQRMSQAGDFSRAGAVLFCRPGSP